MIYCVEDDDSIRELVLYTLQSTGFSAKGFSNAEDMYNELNFAIPSLIILDIMLPGKDGLEILRSLRQNPKTKSIPIMMATAKGTEYDKVVGLDIGADDYLVKPFGMMELIARIKALIRRSSTDSQPTNTVTIGKISIDLIKHSVTASERNIVLTYKEFEVLSMLMREPGRVFTRDVILSSIWGYEFDGETRTVDVHVRTLRQKLGDDGAQIHTVRGVGYSICEGR